MALDDAGESIDNRGGLGGLRRSISNHFLGGNVQAATVSPNGTEIISPVFKIPFQTNSTVGSNAGIKGENSPNIDLIDWANPSVEEESGNSCLRELGAWCGFITNTALSVFSDLINESDNGVEDFRDAREKKAKLFMRRCLDKVNSSEELKFLPLMDDLKTKELIEYEEIMQSLERFSDLSLEALEKKIDIATACPGGLHLNEDVQKKIKKAILHIDILKIKEQQKQLTDELSRLSSTATKKKAKLESELSSLKLNEEQLSNELTEEE